MVGYREFMSFIGLAFIVGLLLSAYLITVLFDFAPKGDSYDDCIADMKRVTAKFGMNDSEEINKTMYMVCR